jgi:hypothetical protein
MCATSSAVPALSTLSAFKYFSQAGAEMFKEFSHLDVQIIQPPRG